MNYTFLTISYRPALVYIYRYYSVVRFKATLSDVTLESFRRYYPACRDHRIRGRSRPSSVVECVYRPEMTRPRHNDDYDDIMRCGNCGTVNASCPPARISIIQQPTYAYYNVRLCITTSAVLFYVITIFRIQVVTAVSQLLVIIIIIIISL